MAVIYYFTHDKILTNFLIVEPNVTVDIDGLAKVVHQHVWSKTDIELLKVQSDGSDTFNLHKNTFFAPHWHIGEEKRLFLAGSGIFFIPTLDQVIIIQCSTGDLITVADKTVHWFCGKAGLSALRFFGEISTHTSYYHHISSVFTTLFSNFDDVFLQQDSVHMIN